MKTKYATVVADALKKMIKYKHLRKYWFMTEQLFLELSRDSETHELFTFIAHLGKKSVFAERNIFSLKKINHILKQCIDKPFVQIYLENARKTQVLLQHLQQQKQPFWS